MINKDGLPLDAPSSVLGEHCDTGVSILLNLHRVIDEKNLSEAYMIQNTIQDMITELEEIKENGE